ncbi:MAG: hypothetical protein QM709_00870 [Spongiibacteraceae bacterium]
MMKKLLASMLVAGSVGLVSAPSHAGIFDFFFKKPPAKSVPEMNASGAAISLALLAGVMAIRAERRFKKK